MNDLPTLYRLADGTQADPGECSTNDKGVLCHQNGVPVVIDSDGKPLEIAREAVINKAAQAADAGKDADAAAKAANDGEKSANDVRVDAGLQPVEPNVDTKAPAVADASQPADDSKTGQTL